MTLCHYDKLYRNIYMEGPPNRGENKEDYITQIAVPIKG